MKREARICYIAIPTSLTLQSANAIQTWTTMRELKRLRPETLALIPRWAGEPSRFEEVGAVHLPRPAIGKLSRLYKTTLLYYLEYSAFAWMCFVYLLLERLRGRRYDVVYVRQPHCAAWFAGVFGRLLGVRVVFEAHDLETRNPSRVKERWAVGLPYLMDRVNLLCSTAVASLTEHFLRELGTVGWQPSIAAVIPDAFDDRLYYPRDKDGARDRLGIDRDSFIVAYAGMSFAHRGLDRLIAAFAAADLHGARLILVGGRPKEIESLQEQIHRLNVQGSVELAGPKVADVVSDYMAAADLLVIPDTLTDVTASPLKLFEYMAMGRPIVTIDLPALREIVDERAARFVRRGDTGELRDALRELAQDDDRRAAMGQAAHAQATPWTYAARAQRIVALCDRVLRAEH